MKIVNDKFDLFKADILADSKHPNGSRLVTMELTYPRCIHAEFMTHRQFSRNAASSRAIPITRMIKDVEENPFIPKVWGINKSGMQSEELHEDPDTCKTSWLEARDAALFYAKELNEANLHKQIVNRILEPWMWITVIATGVDHAWENFFKLRCDEYAEPHIQHIAYMIRDAYDANIPNIYALHIDDDTSTNNYHLPLYGFPGDEALSTKDAKKVSVARCARVSYLTHDGIRDVQADIALYDRIEGPGHWSPFEHVAKANMDGTGTSNFGPYWDQFRKDFSKEYCTKAPREKTHVR